MIYYKPITGIHWSWSYEDDIDTQIAKKLKESNDEEPVPGKMQLRSIMKKTPVYIEDKNKVKLEFANSIIFIAG